MTGIYPYKEKVDHSLFIYIIDDKWKTIQVNYPLKESQFSHKMDIQTEQDQMC